MIEIDISDVQKHFDKLEADFEHVITDILTRVALETEGELKTKSPVDTGELRASIGTKITETEAIIGSDRPHAWILGGMKPQTIVPVRAKALHFHMRGVGEVFAKSVEHPGFPDILSEVEGGIPDKFSAISQEVIGRLFE